MGCIALGRYVLVLGFSLAGVVLYPYVGWSSTVLEPAYGYHTNTPTHIEAEQYNPWNNSKNKSQAPEDGCINIRNMMSIK